MPEKISISTDDIKTTKGIAERGELEIRRGDGLTHALLRSLLSETEGDTSTTSMRDAYLNLSIESRKNLLKLAAELSAEGQKYYSPKKGLKKYQAGDLTVDVQSVIRESTTTESPATPKRIAKKKPNTVMPQLGATDHSPEPTIDEKNIKTLQEKIKSKGYLEALKMVHQKGIILRGNIPLSKGGYLYSGSDIDNIDYALLPDQHSASYFRLFDKPVGDYRIVYYLEKNPSNGDMTLKGTMIIKKDGSHSYTSGENFVTPFDPKPHFQ